MNPVAVIVPTLCNLERQAALERAIDSVVTQEGVHVQIVVSVNGTRVHEPLFSDLSRRPSVTVLRIPEPSQIRALVAARQALTAPFVAFLDDDDILLPGSLATRLEALESDGLGFVATNGYRPDSTLVCTSADRVNQQPLAALLEANWLASCAGLFRAEALPASVIANTIKYHEWTYIAFELLLRGQRFRFLDVPGYRLFETPNSASQQRTWDSFTSAVRMFEHLYKHAPPDVRMDARRKYLNGLHATSDFCRAEGDVVAAWKYHLLSLSHGGWQFLPYTRRLLVQVPRPPAATQR